MKRLLLTSTVLAFTLGGALGTWAANPPPGPNYPPGDPMAYPQGPGFDHPGFAGPGGGPRWPGPQGHHDEEFSLFAHVQDKKLGTADVKTIAAAILLEHGNHDWTVADVASQADKTIDFSFTTARGDIIATFAVDAATGRIKRIG